MRKFFAYLLDNAWTWAGTGMVLITLSGPTLRQATLITGFTILLHSVVTLAQKDSD
jgi:hypothetical protein